MPLPGLPCLWAQPQSLCQQLGFSVSALGLHLGSFFGTFPWYSCYLLLTSPYGVCPVLYIFTWTKLFVSALAPRSFFPWNTDPNTLKPQGSNVRHSFPQTLVFPGGSFWPLLWDLCPQGPTRSFRATADFQGAWNPCWVASESIPGPQCLGSQDQAPQL